MDTRPLSGRRFALYIRSNPFDAMRTESVTGLLKHSFMRFPVAFLFIAMIMLYAGPAMVSYQIANAAEEDCPYDEEIGGYDPSCTGGNGGNGGGTGNEGGGGVCCGKNKIYTYAGNNRICTPCSAIGIGVGLVVGGAGGGLIGGLGAGLFATWQCRRKC